MSKTTAYWSIGLIALISIASILQLPHLTFNFDFDDFFEKNDPNWQFYEQHLSEYGHDNDYLLVAIENRTGVFNPHFLGLFKELTVQINAIEGVTKVLDPVSAKKIVQSPMGTMLLPYLHIMDSELLRNDSLSISNHSNLADQLINTEKSAVSMIVYHDRFDDKMKEAQLNKDINDIIQSFGFDDYHVAGRIRAQAEFISLVKQNFSVFLLLSALLIVLILSYLFRSIKWVVIPVVVIALSVIVSIGVMVFSGQAIDVLSSMLPTILLVTAMSDITHFLTRFFDLQAAGSDKSVAVKATLKEVGLATLLTSVTTAIGFLTLVITDSLPVRNLGIYTAIGVMVTYIITFSLLPSIATLTKPDQKTANKKWNQVMGFIFIAVLRNRTIVLIFYAVLGVASLWSIRNLVIDTPLIADFPKDHTVTKDFQFFDQHFGGSKPIEINIQVKGDGDILSPHVINEIGLLTSYLNNRGSNFVGPDHIVKTINMANHGGQPEFYSLPDKTEQGKVRRQFAQIAHHFPYTLVSDDKASGRISGFSKDSGSRVGLQFQEDFKRYVDSNINHDLLEVRLTGTSYLFDLTTESLVTNIIYGLSIAMAVVAFVMVFLFRSFKMILIALIPNVLPLIFLAAIMVLFEIPLRLSTSIIFAIAFGIAVDDTIHFLARFNMERKGDVKLLPALKNTFLSTGKAMVITSVILSSGFMLFIFSSFDATFYTGLLISLTLGMALIVDLTLLPVLLLGLKKKESVRSI